MFWGCLELGGDTYICMHMFTVDIVALRLYDKMWRHRIIFTATICAGTNCLEPNYAPKRRLTTAHDGNSNNFNVWAAKEWEGEWQNENGMSENREMFLQAKYHNDTQICGCEKNHRASNSSQRRRWRLRIFALTSQTNTRKTPTHKWRAHRRQTHMCDDSRWWARGTRLHKFCCVLSLSLFSFSRGEPLCVRACLLLLFHFYLPLPPRVNAVTPTNRRRWQARH